MAVERGDVLKLLQWLDQTAAREIDCEEFLHRVAGFIERLAAGGGLSAEWAEVAQHLRVCPECLEEFEVLRDLLRGLE